MSNVSSVRSNRDILKQSSYFAEEKIQGYCTWSDLYTYKESLIFQEGKKKKKRGKKEKLINGVNN